MLDPAVCQPYSKYIGMALQGFAEDLMHFFTWSGPGSGKRKLPWKNKFSQGIGKYKQSAVVRACQGKAAILPGLAPRSGYDKSVRLFIVSLRFLPHQEFDCGFIGGKRLFPRLPLPGTPARRLL